MIKLFYLKIRLQPQTYQVIKLIKFINLSTYQQLLYMQIPEIYNPGHNILAHFNNLAYV